MDNETKEFGLFIDGLRLERNISREDLCDGILSLSQYKRYLKGEASIPNDKLVLIADKLKFSINDFYLLFRKKYNDEYSKIVNIYSLIKVMDFKQAYIKAKKMQNDIIVSQYNKLFYDFCLIKIQHKLHFVSDVHVLELYSVLINYPKCADNEAFNMVEISALIEITSISAKIGNYEPMDLMYRLITSKNFNYSASGDSSFLPAIYSSLAKTLGSQGEHEKVVEISNKGIQYCLEHESSNALTYLYFFNALANLNLDNKEIALQSAKKCFMLLYVEEKAEMFNSLKDVFEREFKISLDDLIQF